MQVKHRLGAPPGPLLRAKTKKRRNPVRLREGVCDVFVVSGATAVGYL
jgi:hypothetical protein